MDVVDREKTRDSLAPGGGRDKTCHPVVAVDKVRLDARDNIVDYLALKRKRQLQIILALGIYRIAIVETTIFGKVNSFVRHAAFINPKFFSNEFCGFLMKHSPIVR
jgi:hypothetical protein